MLVQVDPHLSRTVVVSTKLDTRLPQFARGHDVELFLRPSGRLLEPGMLGGCPFFTWGPFQQAPPFGASSDLSRDHIVCPCMDEVQGSQSLSLWRQLLACTTSLEICEAIFELLSNFQVLQGAVSGGMAIKPTFWAWLELIRLLCRSVPSGRVGNAKDAIFRSNEHFREAVGERESLDVQVSLQTLLQGCKRHSFPTLCGSYTSHMP